MEKELTFKERHIKIDKELQKVSSKVFEKSDLKIAVICQQIAIKYQVTRQTVYNYAIGRGKDGYLKDSILQEFKKL